MSKTKVFKTEMKELIIENRTFEVSESVYHFYFMMQTMDREIKDANQLISDYLKFIDLWDNYKIMKNQSENESEFEKKIAKHILVHTIKPRTEYANQQEKRNGKNILYPIYSFGTNGQLRSMAPGGNYPIKDCNIFVKSDKGGYIKIK